MRDTYRRRGAKLFVTCAMVALAASALGARAGATPQSTTTEKKSFEIVSVAGNHVVIKDAQGARELTVPADFRVDVGGKMVGVSELKPGMKGTATITTTTTVHTVYVTDLKEAKIHKIVGRNIIVMMKGETGFKMFTQEDAEKNGRHVLQNGKPIDWETLRAGDTLSATIVTEGPSQTMTERQVDVKMAEMAKAAPPPPTMLSPPTGSHVPAGSGAALGAPPPPPPPAAGATPAATPASSGSATPDSSARREPPGAPNAIPTSPDTATTPPAEATTWNPLLVAGIVIALIVIGVIFVAMRRKEDQAPQPRP